jgi:hypothetical protein
MADRAAILIIRAWIEAGSSAPLRVNIRSTTDVSAGIERTTNAAEVETVVGLVRAWLGDVEADGGQTQEDDRSRS